MNLDTAVAMDGGSLMLSFSDGEHTLEYVINRSIASIDAERHEEVLNESGVLSSDERVALLKRLQVLRHSLPDADPNIYVLDQFLVVLGKP